jgi:coniferyl-aldehyde dehydrogenase
MSTPTGLDAILYKQRQAYLRAGPPGFDERINHLDALLAQVIKNKDRMADVLCEDFGNRSRHETLIAETMATVNAIKHAKKHLKKWMAPEKRPLPLQFKAGKAFIHYQPLGVIGIMAPWNYAYQLSLVPLAQALAAGNRVMLKTSEFTPGASALMHEMLSEAFGEDRVVVIEGGPEIAQEFSRQKFDHLMFTGSTPTGHKVMMAAAENMVPVTLELGGKSPTIIGDDYDLTKAAGSIAMGKLMNAGQTCIAPDYSFVPEGKIDAFADALSGHVHEMYPTLAANPDYTSIVADRHYERINNLLEDAKAKGARVQEINPANEELGNQRKIAPTLVFDVTEDMAIMQEEIFGPVLPIKPYNNLDEVIDYVNDHDRPLALYHFTDDDANRDRVMQNTTAGGMTQNDTIMHVAIEELPFGGVGPSGLGSYHGHAGFKTFSHAKSIFRAGFFGGTSMLRPPFGPKMEKMINMMIGK